MVTPVNALDVHLQAEPKRTLAPRGGIILSCTANTITVASGVGSPGIITLVATPLSLVGTVQFTTSPNVPLTIDSTGLIATLKYSDMGTSSVVVTATLTAGGIPYTDVQTISQLSFGSLGYTGAANATANTSTRGVLSARPTGGDGDFYFATDTITLYQKVSGAWQVAGTTVTNTNQIADGAGLGTTSTWGGVSGSGKPADNASSDLVLVGRQVTILGNTAFKSAATGAWDSDAYSVDSFTGGAYATAVVVDIAHGIMFGLNSDPKTDSNYAGIDYAILIDAGAGGVIRVYESGNNAGSFGNCAAGDVLAVVYDGSSVRYLKNGTVLYTSVLATSKAAGQTLYFDSSFYDNGGTLKNIRFGPMTSNNWTNIGGTGKPADGATANNVTTGTLAARPTGANGDFYFATDNLTLYQKVNGNWISGPTVGAPLGTMVGGTEAGLLASRAANGDAANNAVNNPSSGLAQRMSLLTPNILTGSGGFVAGTLQYDANGVRTGGYGVAYNQKGIAAYNSAGVATYILDAASGAQTLRSVTIVGDDGSTIFKSSQSLAAQTGVNPNLVPNVSAWRSIQGPAFVYTNTAYPALDGQSIVLPGGNAGVYIAFESAPLGIPDGAWYTVSFSAVTENANAGTLAVDMYGPGVDTNGLSVNPPSWNINGGLGQRYSFTEQMPAGGNGKAYLRVFNPGGAERLQVRVWDVKVEYGQKATAWCNSIITPNNISTFMQAASINLAQINTASIGSLSALSANFGNAHMAYGGGLSGGAYSSYNWPRGTGITGFYLGPEGLMLGCLDGGAYFNADQYGNIYAPNFTIINGIPSFNAPVITNANISGGTVSGGTSLPKPTVTGTGPISSSGGNGSRSWNLSVSAGGGSGNYTYAWAFGGGTDNVYRMSGNTASSSVIVGLTGTNNEYFAQVYCVVTDNGLSTTFMVTIDAKFGTVA